MARIKQDIPEAPCSVLSVRSNAWNDHRPQACFPFFSKGKRTNLHSPDSDLEIHPKTERPHESVVEEQGSVVCPGFFPLYRSGTLPLPP